MKRKFHLALYLGSALLCLYSLTWVTSPQANKTEKPASRLNVANVLTKDEKQRGVLQNMIWLGITNRDEMLFSREVGRFTSRLYWFSCTSGRLLRTKETKLYETNSYRLSQDGSLLFVPEVIDFSKPHIPIVYTANSSSAEPIKTINVGPKTNAFRPYAIRSDRALIAVPVLESLWDAERKDWVGDPEKGTRIELWNWRMGKRQLSISYPYAPDLTDVMISPDGKQFYCFDTNSPINNSLIPWDVDSSPYASIMDVYDVATGKKLWHVESDIHLALEEPLFFLSSTRLVARDTIYDLQTKKVTPLFLGSGKNKFRAHAVGDAHAQLARGFFLTPQGLALWDVANNRLLHRWPNIKVADQVTLSPSLKILSVKNKAVFEFWKFDPKWLK